MSILSNLAIYAQTDIQKGVYDAAEEMIRFDEKMNRAIAQHNNLSSEDEDEMRLNSMVEDFEETKNGYLLKRDIPENNQTKVQVKLEDGVLTISTSTIEKELIEGEAITGYETTMSSSSISLFLPNDADENQMQKRYENGVLMITFPKK
jgi:HSP20 family molecular chaperone IbpA